ncbi:MAG TPA: gluconate 2-dehydrogenase subunit 3 family protein, partial [Thermoanaerobaculia bacterium]|nr:gluconate 2-dehydrogenase subunit 3 family protein [Thermoanaerobaculia bacterium]
MKERDPSMASADSPETSRRAPASPLSTPLTRRRVLGLLGASAAGALGAPGVHPLVPVQEGEVWQPRFLDSRQHALVEELAERIIPKTDTPGARAALVHQYIDWVLSEATAEAQRAFVAGLEWIDAESRSRFGKPFLDLGAAEGHDLLGRLASAAESSGGAPPAEAPGEVGVAFFRDLKRRTIHGYYRSEIGMLDELGYEGNRYLSRFDGCQHPEHHAWQPA